MPLPAFFNLSAACRSDRSQAGFVAANHENHSSQSEKAHHPSAGLRHGGHPSAPARSAAAPASDIDVVETRLPSSRVQLSVTVPPKHVAAAYDAALAQARRSLTVPGFRKGAKARAAGIWGVWGERG